MPRLERIRLINAAGFDEVDFPVNGHCQVIGVNGHGKSTLLRTVLFFYLGTNEKAPYALHDTKKDFVSHYLGDPPGYLIYEVARDASQPGYHIAVTRPAGRIQFHFVDAPFRRDYYVDGKVVLPIERVQDQWRDARCAVETLWSYEDFAHRIYGIVPSTYAVFRPAERGASQVSVLPRIISGIFTVSQLDADKLKSALTCGVRSDASAAELDLVQLKNQLEHFRRVNRAVKTFLRHEQDAVNLVELAASFDIVKGDRRRAIEGLVRAAKFLPEEARWIEEHIGLLKDEEAEEEAEFKCGNLQLSEAIQKRGEEIAVLGANIKTAKEISTEYVNREIERKAKELDSLQEREEERRLAEREHASLTAEFVDENQRKEQLLDSVRLSWSELTNGFQKRRFESGERFRFKFTELEAEKDSARTKIAHERNITVKAVQPRREKLNRERTVLNDELRAFADIAPPREIAETEGGFRQAERKQNQESAQQERFRSELALARQEAKMDREKLDRDAADEKVRIEAAIANLDGERSRTTAELEKFDTSLAHFFQTQSPHSWQEAAKTLNHELLFRNAHELEAEAVSNTDCAVWGVKISTTSLADSTEAYDRARLTTALQELRKKLAGENEALNSAQARYVAGFDAQEKRHAQIVGELEGKIAASVEACGKLGNEVVRLENHLLNLQSQFNAAKLRRREELDMREATWKADDEVLRKEEGEIEQRFRSLQSVADDDFKARREKLTEAENASRADIDLDEKAARLKRDADVVRIERESQRALSEKGANAERIAAAQKRFTDAEKNVHRIEEYREEVAEYRKKKIEWMDRLPGWESERPVAEEIQRAKQTSLGQLAERNRLAKAALAERAKKLNDASGALQEDQKAVARFQKDMRFLQEWGYFDRPDLPPASFHQTGSVDGFLTTAENAHESLESIRKKGDDSAKKFLGHFEEETLKRKLLGFSPPHENFDWFQFVGGELKPFVNNRAITGMKRLQTQQFEQLIHNICSKNAAFRDGIRQVNQTADSVQAHLVKNNFVDVLDSVELKVERVDNQLTRTLEGLERFAGISFSQENDLFAKRADSAEIDRAIEHFERLLREIDTHRSKQLSLTDYFDFLIRIYENGHDMGWRKSLDHIGSTGTDYLVKMLIYLSLIEVYRSRAIDAKAESTVHCVMDETGVLAPKYVRAVLAYAAERGIILITAGHSQQTTGFDHWILVRKQGPRFGGQTVLRKVLRCD